MVFYFCLVVGLADQQLRCICQIYMSNICSQQLFHLFECVCDCVHDIAIETERIRIHTKPYICIYMIIPYDIFILYSISLAFCSYHLTLHITSRQPMFSDICKPKDRWPCGKWHFTANGHVTDWQTTYRCVVILDLIKKIYMKWMNCGTVFHSALSQIREQTIKII